MKSILLTSIGFSPNVGGIESHFDDLVTALNRKKTFVNVLTYMPLTSDVKAKFVEKDNGKLIIRMPIFGKFFYAFNKFPIFQFIYLVPGLFVAMPIFLAIKPEVKTIHSHGLVAGFVAVFWGKIFGRKVITTTHSIYNFPEKSLYTSFAKFIFNSSNKILTLSKQSKQEIVSLNIDANKISIFTYWIDLNNFKKVKNAKKILDLSGKFVTLFVGRLLPEKGVRELLNAFSEIKNKSIVLLVVGEGLLSNEVVAVSKQGNIRYVGRKNREELPTYYSAADLLVIPSTHEEGFGRVILESLACGTPVLGSNRGAIPEALDKNVGTLVDVSPSELKKNILYFYKNRSKLNNKALNCRKYAKKHFSERNVEKIIKYYEF